MTQRFPNGIYWAWFCPWIFIKSDYNEKRQQNLQHLWRATRRRKKFTYLSRRRCSPKLASFFDNSRWKTSWFSVKMFTKFRPQKNDVKKFADWNVKRRTAWAIGHRGLRATCIVRRSGNRQILVIFLEPWFFFGYFLCIKAKKVT